MPNAPLTSPRALPSGAVEPYLANVTGLTRRVPAAFQPRSEDEVSALVARANAERLTLYPVGCGKNWGLGSKLPVRDGAAIVDLSQMTRIVEVHERERYALVEPGVTQAALARYLREHHPSLLHNNSGSFAYTSVVGNVLDRGDAIYHERADDLLGVRGVLGCGAPFEVGGYWSLAGKQPTHAYPRGVGPDLRGLFSQANFGIVTQAAIRLVRRPESVQWLWASVPSSALAQLIDDVERLCEQEVLDRNATRIGYVNRFTDFVSALFDAPSAAEERPWLVYAIIKGSERSAKARLEEARPVFERAALRVGAVDVWRDGDLHARLPPLLHPLISLLQGEPDSNSVRAIYDSLGVTPPERAAEMDPDHTVFGMKALLPVVPATGGDVMRAVELVSAVGKEHGFPIQLTWNWSAKTLVTINFRRDDPAQSERADACYRALFERLWSAGYPPYRMAIDQMQHFAALQPGLASLTRRLKSALDPNDVIAPGRYAG